MSDASIASQPKPIRHVKRPTERFDKFDNQRFPSSKFTMEGTLDSVMYHPLYNRFRPLGVGTCDDPLDHTQENPPEN